MWKDLNLEQMAEEEHARSPSRSPAEVEEIVVMARLDQHNRGQPCGADALRKRLKTFYHLKPLPSARTIGQILTRHGLTESRTGQYTSER